MVIKIDRAAIQRKNIIKHSFILFKKQGYNNTTTREIAEASGIRKGLLHYYYNQKEDILIEMYNNILTSINNFVSSEYKDTLNGFTYYAVFNILFFRTMSSKTYLTNMLSDMMLYQNLTQIKIEKSVELCYRIIQNYNIPITEYQLLLGITVAVGAEAELLSSIQRKKLKMTYDKLATTLNKLLFTMLKINEKEIKSINIDSMKLVDNININYIYQYLKENNSWLQD